MKKPYVIAIVVAVLILGFITYLYFHNSNQTVAIKEEVKASVTATTLEKTLLIKSAGDTSESEVESKKVATEGDTLKTLTAGRALLENSNGTVTVMDYDTSMTIARQDEDATHSSNFLHLGTVFAQVKKVFDKGEFYEIETQNAVAVARGTTLQVSYHGLDTILLVKEGSVALIPVDIKTRERHVDKEMLVTTGMKGIIGADGKVVVSEMNEKEKQDAFMNYSLNLKTGSSDQNGSQAQETGTFRSLMAIGKDVMCTYTFGEGEVLSTGTMYISGTNMRGDYSIKSGASGTTDSHMVRNGNTMYTWSGNQGAKISIDQPTDTTDSEVPVGNFNLDQQFNYNCKPWQKDESKFGIPKDVNFIDIGAMMKAQQGMYPNTTR